MLHVALFPRCSYSMAISQLATNVNIFENGKINVKKLASNILNFLTSPTQRSNKLAYRVSYMRSTSWFVSLAIELNKSDIYLSRISISCLLTAVQLHWANFL